MPKLPVSLFVKEPGKTRTLILEEEALQKTAGGLKLADILEIKKENGKIIIFSQSRGKIAEIGAPELAAKLSFALENKADLKVIFVSLSKNTAGKTRVQFILRSSLPIFANEKTSALKPFWRGLEVGHAEKGDEEKAPEENLNEEEPLREDETNPLSGLNLVDPEKPSHAEE